MNVVIKIADFAKRCGKFWKNILKEEVWKKTERYLAGIWKILQKTWKVLKEKLKYELCWILKRHL